MDLVNLRHSLNSSGESSASTSNCSSRNSSRCNSRSNSSSRRGGGRGRPAPALVLETPVVSLAKLRLDSEGDSSSPVNSPPATPAVPATPATPATPSTTTSSASSTPDGQGEAGGTSLPLMQCGSLRVCAERLRRCGMESLSGKPQQRLSVLSFEQVQRLSDMMDEVVSIHGRGNFPTLEVRLRDLVAVVRSKLEADMTVRDIRLNGGGASHVLASDPQPYNDLDLIFGVELSAPRNFDRVKAAVLGSLMDLLPEGVSRKRITTCSLKEAYVSKMVKVNHDGDRWSLISLGNSRGHKNVELKFVDTMRRPFEFSVDSFQIVLDSLLLFYECSDLPISENFYPTVVGESVYGDFQEALYHLQKKLIATRCPEEIRGGGLLKYCNLLVRNYRPARSDMKGLERYMCSRFFIDFPDIAQQRAKLQSYLTNHFVGRAEEALRYRYLLLLRRVVEQSTVCLMGHERRQTLQLIEQLAGLVLSQEQALQGRMQQGHQAGPTALVYTQHGYFYAPVIPSYTACSCSCNAPQGWMATCSS